MYKADVGLNLNKWNLFSVPTAYPGHLFQAGYLQLPEHTKHAAAQLEPPNPQTELCYF